MSSPSVSAASDVSCVAPRAALRAASHAAPRAATRRAFIGKLAAGAAAAGVAAAAGSAFNLRPLISIADAGVPGRPSKNPPKDLSGKIKPVATNHPDFAWVRGFNYQPGFSRGTGGYDDGTGWDIWRELPLDVIERQLARARELFPAATALRLWLPYNVWLAQPRRFEDDFAAFVAICAKNKFRVMPMLFNAWHGTPDFGGFRSQCFDALRPEQLQKTFDYATALFERHADNPAIFAWDLCNEPEYPRLHEPYCKWLERLYAHIKTRWPKSVLTVGAGGDGCGKDKSTRRLERICDVLGPRLYFLPGHAPDAYQNWINEHVAYTNEVRKPLIVTETGWPRGGSVAGKARAQDGLRIELGVLNNAKFGWLIHALWESPVADLHRESDGPRGVGYMGCINKDGSLREGHEIINQFLEAK
ncbi:MAG: hypothetical protein LBR07_01610 [Puniceicoccales bacterium]|nr:hypothetical protein [Puniceicoccales bacterium]